MKVVGIRELKSRLSEYVRAVRAGEDILLTDRGEVVALLKRPEGAGLEAGLTPAEAALARRGGVTLGGPNDPALYPVLPAVLPEGEAQRLLSEERGER